MTKSHGGSTDVADGTAPASIQCQRGSCGCLNILSRPESSLKAKIPQFKADSCVFDCFPPDLVPTCFRVKGSRV